jgi:cold shock CspA family protein
MAKSQETFNKKEKVKKRLKKRQDKAEKKEERKATAVKPKSLEELYMYVDENGNLTSTPPDPKKKRIINTDDIVIGATKREPVDPADIYHNGIVTMFNSSKGFGFIRDLKTQESIFVHVNSADFQIQENDKVTFEVGASPRGPNAINVTLTK